MSQLRLKVSVNVNLDDILCITELFVAKPSMVIHHYKPEHCIMCEKWVSFFKVKGTVTEFAFIQWNHDYFYYIFWTDFLATNLVWQCMFITSGGAGVSCGKVALLYSRSRSQWMFWTSVNVCPDNISDWSNLVWWCIIISQSIIQKYNFCDIQVKATIVCTRSSEILKPLQSKLVWWYIITRQGKTPWKDFLAFTQGMRQSWIIMAWGTVD